MTREQLYALPTYTNWTMGRPLELPDPEGFYRCAGCGELTRHPSAVGLCGRCSACRRSTGELLELKKKGKQ